MGLQYFESSIWRYHELVGSGRVGFLCCLWS